MFGLILKNFIADSGILVNQRIVWNSFEISFEIIEQTHEITFIPEQKFFR